MTKGKLSLVAALALASGLQAADIKYDERLGITVAGDKGYTERKEKPGNIRFDGQLRFWYQTMDHEGISNGKSDRGLFQRDPNQGNEWGNVEAQFSISGNINEHLKAKTTMMTVSTMGMNSQLTVGETARASQTGASNAIDAQPFWLHEMFLDYAISKTTDIKIGRMELNTPLIYTEKWNATSNAFEAITATNTYLPDTTMTAAWISKGNGAQANLVSAPQVFGAESTFNEFMKFADVGSNNAGGMIVVGAQNKSIASVPVQGWLYVAPDAMQAYWVQADLSAKDLGPVNAASVQLVGAGIGTQGKTEDYLKADSQSNGNTKTAMTNAVAGKVAASAGMFNAYAAFSQTTNGNVPVANMGTNYKKTKLPTASIFNDGMVAAQPDTTAWKLGVGANFDGIGSIALSYGSYTVGENEGYQNINKNAGGPASMGYIAQNFVQDDIDVDEIDVVFKTKVKDVDIAAMYIKVNKTYVPILGNSAANGGGTAGYGTLANDIVRVVATLKF